MNLIINTLRHFCDEKCLNISKLISSLVKRKFLVLKNTNTKKIRDTNSNRDTFVFVVLCLEISFEMLSFSLLFFFSFLSCGFSIPSQKPQAIIHIGPHATGSTSFQRSLNIEANKEAFKKNGFWVAMESESFVHGLKKDSSSSSPNDRKFNQLVQTIKEKKRSFILSSEEFDGLTSVSIKALEQILEGYDVVIVAFHRQPTDHLRSLWAQANKMEQSPLPFAIWANEFYTQLQSVDLLSLLGQFSETFGEKSIKLLSFEGSLFFFSFF